MRIYIPRDQRGLARRIALWVREYRTNEHGFAYCARSVLAKLRHRYSHAALSTSKDSK